jgi:hypothetical protein
MGKWPAFRLEKLNALPRNRFFGLPRSGWRRLINYGVFVRNVKVTELPIVRYPLSRNPSIFVTGAGQTLGSIQIPGTDLHFCPHSDTPQKAKQLKRLFSQLVLPDGRPFPDDGVDVSISNER